MDTNTEKQEYTITVYTENQVGLLNRIAIIFSRRKINVESLNTSPSEIDGIHRFTIVIHESRSVVIKLVRQIEKQVEVLKTYFNVDKWSINQPIILKDLYVELSKIQGVQSVKNIEILNKSGIINGYSQYAYDIVGANQNGIIYPSLDPSVFEIKYPNSDIQGRVVSF